jgi:hypothetical protein
MRYIICWALVMGLVIYLATELRVINPVFIMIWLGLGAPALAFLKEYVDAGCHHQPVSGYQGAATYGRITYKPIDAINTMHANIDVECRKCGKHYNIAKIHIRADDKEGVEKGDIVYKT